MLFAPPEHCNQFPPRDVSPRIIGLVVSVRWFRDGTAQGVEIV